LRFTSSHFVWHPDSFPPGPLPLFRQKSLLFPSLFQHGEAHLGFFESAPNHFPSTEESFPPSYPRFSLGFERCNGCCPLHRTDLSRMPPPKHDTVLSLCLAALLISILPLRPVSRITAPQTHSRDIVLSDRFHVGWSVVRLPGRPHFPPTQSFLPYIMDKASRVLFLLFPFFSSPDSDLRYFLLVDPTSERLRQSPAPSRPGLLFSFFRASPPMRPETCFLSFPLKHSTDPFRPLPPSPFLLPHEFSAAFRHPKALLTRLQDSLHEASVFVCPTRIFDPLFPR